MFHTTLPLMTGCCQCRHLKCTRLAPSQPLEATGLTLRPIHSQAELQSNPGDVGSVSTRSGSTSASSGLAQLDRCHPDVYQQGWLIAAALLCCQHTYLTCTAANIISNERHAMSVSFVRVEHFRQAASMQTSHAIEEVSTQVSKACWRIHRLAYMSDAWPHFSICCHLLLHRRASNALKCRYSRDAGQG